MGYHFPGRVGRVEAGAAPPGLGSTLDAMARTKAQRAPRRMRQPLKDHEPGAHLHATFWTHVKAGLVSLAPFALLYFTAQPLEDAMSFLASGGFTIAPTLLAVYSCGWALMSMALLHRLRFSESVAHHYIVYAIAGAVALPVLAIAILTLVRLAVEGSADFWNATTFGMLMIASPLLGALGAVIGRRVLAPGIHWNRWLERAPLPPALEFVEGKRDKDDFTRM